MATGLTRGDDLIFELMDEAAKKVGTSPKLPFSLSGTPIREATKRRGDLLAEIGTPICGAAGIARSKVSDPYDIKPQIPHFLDALRVDPAFGVSGDIALFLDDVPALDDKINICIRLYNGYLSGAKVVAWKVRGRKSTAATRSTEIQAIEKKAAVDDIYKAEVEAVPHFKWRIRGENIYKDGILASSVILLDWDD